MFSTARNRRARRSRNRGQSLVEFALAMPFLMLVIVSIMYFGRVFFVKQSIMLACQEGARSLSRTPNLADPSVRSWAVGFTPDGQLVNPDSVVAGALGAANLLSSGYTGSLPPGTMVKVLPWDATGASGDTVPDGTVAVKIEYPFKFTQDPFGAGGGSQDFGNSIDIWTGPGGAPVSFTDFTIAEKAVALQEIYQQ